jgi:acetyltransferase
MANLTHLFNPQSLAIVGVSHDERKVGYLVAKNLLDQGFDKDIYFVNPKGGEILGRPVYKDLKDIGSPIDLVVLAVPAHIALVVLDQLHDLHIHNVVLFAAGFGEVGKEGEEHQRQLIDKCKHYDIQLLGPNCIGYINTLSGINTTFLKHTSPKGNIGLLSQSGAIGSVIIDYFASHDNLGFSYFMSLGNKTIVDESDILGFLKDDENTKVIGMYLEDVKDGDKFIETLKQTTPHKPVIVLKSGTTEEGAKAALSHTGGLAGSDKVFDAVFQQNGVIRARSYEEFLTLLKICSYGGLPDSEHVLVLSNAGGVGVLMADELVKENLSLVTVSYDIKNKLSGVFGESKKISIRNPIDILGDASAFDYKQAITLTLHEKKVGSVVVLLTPQANTQIDATAKVIIDAQQDFDKPIFPVFMGEKSVKHAHTLFERAQIASFYTYDVLPTAISKLVWYQNWVQSYNTSLSLYNITQTDRFERKEVYDILKSADGKPYTNLQESLSILSHAGIPTGSLLFASSIEQLQAIQNQIPYPAVLKIASEHISHKTEAKGVVAGITSFEDLCNEFYEMTLSHHDAEGCYIQPMVNGYEVFIGAKRDPQFGIIMLFGLGGIYAELLKEVTQMVYPFSYNEFLTVVHRTKLSPFIRGFRGKAPIDAMKLYDIVSRLGMIMEATKSVQEIDINPLFISPDAAVVVDARMIL